MSYHASLLIGETKLIGGTNKLWIDDIGWDLGEIDFNDYTWEITNPSTDAYWLGNRGNWKPTWSGGSSGDRSRPRSTTSNNQNDSYNDSYDLRGYIYGIEGTWCPQKVQYRYQSPTGGTYNIEDMVKFSELKLRVNITGTITVKMSREAGICTRMLLFDESTLTNTTTVDGTTYTSPTCVYQKHLTSDTNSTDDIPVTLTGGKKYTAHFQFNTAANGGGTWGLTSQPSWHNGNDIWGRPQMIGYCITPWETDPNQGTPTTPTYSNLPDITVDYGDLGSPPLSRLPD